MLPGNVRDGDIIGKDLNFQPSVTSLSANWDGFGQPQQDSGQPVVSRTSRWVYRVPELYFNVVVVVIVVSIIIIYYD